MCQQEGYVATHSAIPWLNNSELDGINCPKGYQQDSAVNVKNVSWNSTKHSAKGLNECKAVQE